MNGTAGNPEPWRESTALPSVGVPITLPTSPELEREQAIIDKTPGLDSDVRVLIRTAFGVGRKCQHSATLQSLVAPEELEAAIDVATAALGDSGVAIDVLLDTRRARHLTDACVRAAAPVLTAKLHQEIEKWKSAAMDELERRRTLGAEVTRLREALRRETDLLKDELKRTREALVEMAIPYEAIRMDAASQKWIAPEVWAHIIRATETARKLLEG